MKVRIGIVSWNTAELLDRCLAAVPDALAGLDAEVVVVDNGSSDGSVDVAHRHPSVRVIANDRNLGYAAGMNQALADHDGDEADVLVALNPDTEPPAGSLRALVQRLLDQPDVALVAPRLANSDGSVQHTAYRFPSVSVAAVVSFVPDRVLARGLGRAYWLEGWSLHEERVDVDWVIGAAHVIRASALNGAPPYSERWFMYVEDVELCWRLAQHGWRRRLEGDIVVPHVGNAAGAQAWGTSRTERWLTGTYDFYALARGERRARAWAAVNVLGASWVAVRYAVRGLARGPRRGRPQLAFAREILRTVPVHARALAAGPVVVGELARTPPS